MLRKWAIFKRAGIHSIQTKILLMSLMIALGTTMVSLIVSYYAEVNTVRQMTEKYLMTYISFADQSFNDMLNEARKISLSVATEREVIIPYMADDGLEASYENYQQKKRIKSFLVGLLSQKDYIDRILIVTEDKRIYQSDAALIMRKDLETPVMKAALSAEKAGLIYDRGTQEIFYCCPIISGGERSAVTIVKLNGRLFDAWELEPLEMVNTYIFDKSGGLFHAKTEENGKEEELYQRIRGTEPSSGELSWNGERQYYISYRTAQGNMTAVSVIPYRVLMKDVGSLRNTFLLIGLAAVLCANMASVYLADRLCTKLRRLTDTMQTVQDGNLTVCADISSRDEIGMLAETFNDMMARIRLLLEQVRQKERLKREAEQSVLATQIEPHFLYNSIDSIQYVAHMRGEEEIEKVTLALSELLRSVLSNRNEFITLWEEREYIENYITIERFKYRDDFQMVWDVDEELWMWKVPKLLLQPIVENALIHGISTKESGGLIQVKIYRQEEDVIVKVMDNGKGMSPEKIRQLLNEVQKSDKTGFRRVGFANVMNRIQLIYGEKYGGTVYSCQDMFTCVELRLPAEGGEDGDFGFNC